MKKIAMVCVLAGVCLLGCGGRDAKTPPPVISEDGFDMVFVEGGTFLMGCTDEQGDCYDCRDVENPAREVTVGGFYISRYETTQGLWKAVMGDNPSYFTGDDHLPVEDVSWDEIREFIRRLNRISGREYRLPVETEWEYAARGGNKSNGYKYSGSGSIGDVGWYEDNNDNKTHPVGTKAPNELEIYDMSGNVWEWVDDGSGWGSSKLARGGSVANPAAQCRVSCRGVSDDMHDGGSSLGFRLALSNHHKASSKSLKKSLLAKKDTAGQVAVPVSTLYASFNPDSMDMVFVEGGRFMMGCTAEQGNNCDADEKPARSVTVSNFLIGRYEVTKGLWKVVMKSEPFEFTEDDNLPKVNVDVGHVENFLRELRIKTGKRWYLPSDAQWEYAARGGKYSKGYKYSGSNNIDSVAWYGYDSCFTVGKDSIQCCGNGNSGGKAHPVGTKAPNELGIHDMTGNVGEWVDSDWRWDSDKMSPNDRPYYVYRGGSWFSDTNDSRVSNRNKLDLYWRTSFLGFRIARDAEFTASAPPPDAGSNPDSIAMVFVEGGTFTMGCGADYCFDRVKPAHSVTVGDFSIAKYEVTQGLWRSVMGNNPSHFKGDDRLPVDSVCWNDAQRFIRKLNAKTGKNYRLPTGAEWEFAARGGKKSNGYEFSGSGNSDEVAWDVYNSGYKRPKHTGFGESGRYYNNRTRPVGTKRPNELEIHDMSGNVSEWVNDWYGDYSSEAKTNPLGPPSGTERERRGGDWHSSGGCRVYDRNSGPQDFKSPYTGFRLALD